MINFEMNRTDDKTYVRSEKTQARCGLEKLGKIFWWRRYTNSLPAFSWLCKDRKEEGESKRTEVGRCGEGLHAGRCSSLFPKL